MLMNDKKCPICKSYNLNKTKKKLRSGKLDFILSCDKCQFYFLTTNPIDNLISNKLDETRLKSAGLKIPNIKKDFENGTNQSKPLIEKYFAKSDINKNILEIGCSWGYFINLMKINKCKPYGIELNQVRNQFVNNKLNIKCFNNLDECENYNIKFHKIFLFYVIEYIPDISNYLNRLINLLEDGGKIILITPNLNDYLKDGFSNIGYKNFFYDDNAINYFSVKSLKRIMNKISHNNYSIKTEQGYSFLNHYNWYLTNKPKTTGIVGGDNFINQLTDKLDLDISFTSEIKSLIKNFDKSYKDILNRNNYGNNIIIEISK